MRSDDPGRAHRARPGAPPLAAARERALRVRRRGGVRPRAPLLAEAAAEVAPFAVRLDGIHTFGHRDDATVWLDLSGDTAGWHDLHQALRRRFALPRPQRRASPLI
ncbi:2'-5' RNA ligase family protein [Yinghuangia aomiensis]